MIIDGFDATYQWDKSKIPLWVKDRSGSWAFGQTNDPTFVASMKFLAEEEFLNIDVDEFESIDPSKIPFWYRNVAAWWASNLISDAEFTNSFEFIYEEKILDY